jgi:Na+-driven multidrug efflux pump
LERRRVCCRSIACSGGGRSGGRSGGGGSKGKNKDANDKIKQNIFNLFITLAIIGFLYFINKMFPKQTTAVLKRYEAFDYMNHYVYLIIAIITILLLYIIISAFYNNNLEPTDRPLRGH